jgi:hypothetical protein
LQSLRDNDKYVQGYLPEGHVIFLAVSVVRQKKLPRMEMRKQINAVWVCQRPSAVNLFFSADTRGLTQRVAKYYQIFYKSKTCRSISALVFLIRIKLKQLLTGSSGFYLFRNQFPNFFIIARNYIFFASLHPDLQASRLIYL